MTKAAYVSSLETEQQCDTRGLFAHIRGIDNGVFECYETRPGSSAFVCVSYYSLIYFSTSYLNYLVFCDLMC